MNAMQRLAVIVLGMLGAFSLSDPDACPHLKKRSRQEHREIPWTRTTG
jgi:hypothetical protein